MRSFPMDFGPIVLDLICAGKPLSIDFDSTIFWITVIGFVHLFNQSKPVTPMRRWERERELVRERERERESWCFTALQQLRSLAPRCGRKITRCRQFKGIPRTNVVGIPRQMPPLWWPAESRPTNSQYLSMQTLSLSAELYENVLNYWLTGNGGGDEEEDCSSGEEPNDSGRLSSLHGSSPQLISHVIMSSCEFEPSQKASVVSWRFMRFVMWFTVKLNVSHIIVVFSKASAEWWIYFAWRSDIRIRGDTSFCTRWFQAKIRSQLA